MRRVLLALWAVCTVVVYAMPALAAVPFALLCVSLMLRRKHGELGLLLGTLAVVFVCLELFTRVFADDIFYREHERFALKRRYMAHINTTVTSRFGDLVAMDPSLRSDLAETHTIHVKTDGRGFRNRADYTDEPYVLLGDSFITTVGMTQEDILVYQLNRLAPHTAYSLGFPGVPTRYEGSALMLLPALAPHSRFLWFVYEGNDFEPRSASISLPPPPRPGNHLRYYFTLRALPFTATRVLTLFYRAVGAAVDTRLLEKPPLVVRRFRLAGQEVGFFEEDMHNAARTDVAFHSWGTPGVLDHTACVFFIPDKYRVYAPWLDVPDLPEPPAGMAALQRFFGGRDIRIVDLTPALRHAAKDHLAHGKLVYRRDDTHWNADGIRSVMPEIRKCIAQDRQKHLL